MCLYIVMLKCRVCDIFFVCGSVFISSTHTVRSTHRHAHALKCMFLYDSLIIFFKGAFLGRAVRPDTHVWLSTGASLLLRSVSPPHRLVLMYFSGQQPSNEMSADTSPLVQQHWQMPTSTAASDSVFILYMRLCLRRRKGWTMWVMLHHSNY